MCPREPVYELFAVMFTPAYSTTLPLRAPFDRQHCPSEPNLTNSRTSDAISIAPSEVLAQRPPNSPPLQCPMLVTCAHMTNLPHLTYNNAPSTKCKMLHPTRH